MDFDTEGLRVAIDTAIKQAASLPARGRLAASEMTRPMLCPVASLWRNSHYLYLEPIQERVSPRFRGQGAFRLMNESVKLSRICARSSARWITRPCGRAGSACS